MVARARSLGITTQNKTMGELSLVFSDLWFGTYFKLHLKKYKIGLWKKKEFKDIDDLLVFLYFIL
jgi:hypothetical protein